VTGGSRQAACRRRSRPDPRRYCRVASAMPAHDGHCCRRRCLAIIFPRPASRPLAKATQQMGSHAGHCGAIPQPPPPAASGLVTWPRWDAAERVPSIHRRRPADDGDDDSGRFNFKLPSATLLAASVAGGRRPTAATLAICQTRLILCADPRAPASPRRARSFSAPARLQECLVVVVAGPAAHCSGPAGAPIWSMRQMASLNEQHTTGYASRLEAGGGAVRALLHPFASALSGQREGRGVRATRQKQIDGAGKGRAADATRA
jgi:hypothetical protein